MQHDWIEWPANGSAKNPYGELAFKVEVRFHDGRTAQGHPGSFNWHYNAARANIVAHRPCEVSDDETLQDALKQALYLAVATVAFIGRDEGTDRLQSTLDGLVNVALRTDPVIRRAIALLEKP